jgi:anti-anti-sigma factor
MTAEPASDQLPATGGTPWAFEVLRADPLVVSVGGEIDTLTGPLVRERLAESLDSSDGPVRIELGDVTFIDSQGLSALIAAHRSHPDRTFTLAGVRPNIRRLVEITGLHRVFTVE